MDSGDSCELHPDDSRVRQYPSGTKFSVCGWSVSDPNYCVTFGTTNVSYSCTGDNARGAGGSSGLSKGALIAIIICSIIAGLLLIALIIFLIWYCCCREEESDVKDKKMVALRHLENPDGEFGFDGVVGSMRHPLMYYPGDMEMMPNSLRSYSLAPSSRFDNIVENMESDERDQFCLEEARQRYQLRLLFNEQTELMRIAEKENDLNVTFDNDDLLPRGNAVPEMRPLEIDLDDPNTTAMTDHDMIPNDSLVECPGERVLQSSAPSTPSHQSSFSDDGVVDIDTVPERQYSPEHQPDTTIDQSPIKQNSSLPMPTFVSLPERSVSPQFGHQRTPSDENELSTTTTQRYHDEKRFLLAQEETRRTRLHNWEEEERATLMANELTARQGGKALTPLESPQTRIAAPPSRPRRSGRGSLADPSSSKGTEDEEDIHYYDAPRQPAKMPPLPARPNNNNNNNKNESEDMLAQILGVRFDGSAEL
ncbi:hypothetical protein AGDE_14584 [Angomonas deanei]|uniref:Uncharacterized protein n=1 Tax=Angomonas deanei TaxID=59799 RepID=A0A7G2CT11_9TRYP|nr:hypothetical protein AGDE_14584 [Angomonas deanei]CAD2222074.1 hypothetical protein, conserved [Angomonas deanei]|eukprot:EPY20590.1 hypothetical protein AGDE_14584 [Angomonas deanei]